MSTPETTRQLAGHAGRLLHESLDDDQDYIVIVLTTDAADRTVATFVSSLSPDVRKAVLAGMVQQDEDGTSEPLGTGSLPGPN